MFFLFNNSTLIVYSIWWLSLNFNFTRLENASTLSFQDLFQKNLDTNYLTKYKKFQIIWINVKSLLVYSQRRLPPDTLAKITKEFWWRIYLPIQKCAWRPGSKYGMPFFNALKVKKGPRMNPRPRLKQRPRPSPKQRSRLRTRPGPRLKPRLKFRPTPRPRSRPRPRQRSRQRPKLNRDWSSDQDPSQDRHQDTDTDQDLDWDPD